MPASEREIRKEESTSSCVAHPVQCWPQEQVPATQYYSGLSLPLNSPHRNLANLVFSLYFSPLKAKHFTEES